MAQGPALKYAGSALKNHRGPGARTNRSMHLGLRVGVQDRAEAVIFVQWAQAQSRRTVQGSTLINEPIKVNFSVNLVASLGRGPGYHLNSTEVKKFCVAPAKTGPSMLNASWRPLLAGCAARTCHPAQSRLNVAPLRPLPLYRDQLQRGTARDRQSPPFEPGH